MAAGKFLFRPNLSEVSWTKVTAVVFAAINICQSFGLFTLSPEQLEAVNAFLGSLAVIFLRDSIKA